MFTGRLKTEIPQALVCICTFVGSMFLSVSKCGDVHFIYSNRHISCNDLTCLAMTEFRVKEKA
jgi:hypothetical protein